MKYMKYVLIALLLVGPSAATASIRDGLESMYMVTGNEPTIYQSQRRRGMDFGYLRLRAPVTTYSIVNFSPPSFDAGCGGLDPWGGSFSYIDADQFRQMLRQIGANALGYAFKLAIASMCGICEKTMTDLSNLATKLNAIQVDTCKWGAGIAIDTFEAMGEEVEERYKVAATGAGSFEDTMQAVTNLFADRSEAYSGGDPSGCDPDNPKVCNLTLRALELTDAGDKLQFPGSGALTNNELLMNIAGTAILRAPAASETEEGNVQEPWHAKLRYTHFKNGLPSESGSNNNANPLQRCANTPECTQFLDVPQWELENGVRGWVEGKLEEAAAHMETPATAGSPHPADVQVFLGSVPLTVAGHLLEMQGNHPGLQAYVTAVSPYITDIYASTLALNLVRVIETAYAHPQAAWMPLNVREAIREFYDDAKADRDSVETRFPKVWREAEEIVERHTKKRNEPGVFVLPQQR